MANLVDLDDYKPCDEAGQGEVIQHKVSVCALLLLFGSMRGLEDEDRLCYQDEAGRIEELGDRSV